MRISRVAVIEADCLLENVELWEGELVRPHDVYPDRFDRGRHSGGTHTDSGWRFTSYFLELTSATGEKGIAGPITAQVGQAVLRSWISPLLETQVITPHRVWDEGYRRTPHGRLGEGMLVLSAVELALWDLWGNAHGLPVLDMLGGATRERVPAYASTLGYNVSDLDQVAHDAASLQMEGYAGQKWFLQYGPADGHHGLQQNLALARTLREAVGEGYPLMFDAWQSLDVDYATRLSHGLSEIEPTWLEEPLLPDQLEAMKRLRARISAPIAGGEHLYTRWGYLPHLREGVYDIVQPDLYWAGGLRETMRIAALAESFDVKVIAHAHSSNATTHFTFTQSPATSPMQEHLLRWNMVHQYLLRHPTSPADGAYQCPNQPGLGMQLDLDRALSWRYVS